MSNAEVTDEEAGDLGDAETMSDESDALAARVEVLSEENRRLRSEYRRARQARHRQTALGLGALGILALVGAVIFPSTRTVLLALSGTGLFAAVLVRTLTPERFIAASVGERVYEAYATTGQGLVADLGLSDERVYVPVADTARLYLPQQSPYELPPPEALKQTIVVTDDDRSRGVALQPTGSGLYREFERDLADTPTTEPETLATQLADTLVHAFEVVDEAEPDATTERLSVAVTGSAYGDLAEFDHPVVSFLGVSVAATLSRPVTVDVATEDAEAVVTCRWPDDSEVK